jgi:hypothetical protein
MQCVRLVSGITFISMFKVKNTWWFSCLITSIYTWNFVNDWEQLWKESFNSAGQPFTHIKKTNKYLSPQLVGHKNTTTYGISRPGPGLECTQKTHYFKFQVIFFWNYFRTQLIGLVIRGTNSISFVVICFRALFLSVMPIEIHYCV